MFLPFVLLAPIKIAHQILSILLELLVQIPEPPEFIVVQVRSWSHRFLGGPMFMHNTDRIRLVFRHSRSFGS